MRAATWRRSCGWVGVVAGAALLPACRTARASADLAPRGGAPREPDASVGPAVQSIFGVHDRGVDLSVDLVPPPPATPPLERPGFTPGERFAFTMSVAGVEGGSASIEVDDPTRAASLPASPITEPRVVADVSPDAELLTVSAVGETSPLVASLGLAMRDSLLSYLPLRGAVPLLSVNDDLERGKARHIETWHLGRFVDFDIDDVGHKLRLRRPQPSEVMDGLGALAMLRGRRLVVGDHLSFLLLDEVWLWRIDIDLVGEEYVAVEAGGAEALHFVGTARRADDLGRPFHDARLRKPVELWISADEERVPLKLSAGTRWGDIRGELTSFTPAPGRRSPLVPPSAAGGWSP